MASQLTPISLFLSSPGDVQEERAIVRRVVDHLDEDIARPLGFAFHLMSSDSVLPDAGEPQDVIDRDTPAYDIYVGIMWSRFGTPTGDAGSGTEHEFRCALQRQSVDGDRPRVLFYFCDRPVPFPRSSDDIAQLEAVARFRADAFRRALVTVYTDPARFEDLLRRHLIGAILARVQPPRAPVFGGASAVGELETLLKTDHWIGYGPVDFDPSDGHYPDAASLASDLSTLAAGPFRGLLTFGCERTLSEVPRLARDAGLKGVVMGVYDPSSSADVDAAIRAAPYVHGYCVGHLGIREGRYSLDELIRAMAKLRNATQKPVTTCETIEELMLQPRLGQAVDWLLTDVHAFWHEGSEPAAALEDVLEHLASAKKLRDLIGRDTFVVLNVISYPSSGGPGLTETAQLEFFRRLLQRLKSDVHIPARTYPCYFAAFDNSWKRPDRGWSEPELSTGLYRMDRTPKPAVGVFAASLGRR